MTDYADDTAAPVWQDNSAVQVSLGQVANPQWTEAFQPIHARQITQQALSALSVNTGTNNKIPLSQQQCKKRRSK